MRTRIRYKMLSPLSHIGETASTGSYFQTVLTSEGRIPVVTGNSIRGKIRDNIALHLLETLDCKVEKEAFHVLFSGGNLNGSMKDDIGKAKAVREHFPAVSLMGAGLGDMIMSGKMLVSFACPVCTETAAITGIESDISWHNLIDEIEFTRTDDAKNDKLAGYMVDAEAEISAKAAQQMRFSVQYMAPGTEFVQDIRFLDVTDFEMGAFYAGLMRWFRTPVLGGMGAKGFGLFDAVVGDGDIVLSGGNLTAKEFVLQRIADYESFLSGEGTKHFDLLKSSKAVKKGGKAKDSSD